MTYPHPEIAIEKAAPIRGPLVWEKGDAWHIRTACREYSVAKYAVAAGFRYAAWHFKALLELAGDAESAKRICAAHHAGPVPAFEDF